MDAAADSQHISFCVPFSKLDGAEFRLAHIFAVSGDMEPEVEWLEQLYGGAKQTCQIY
jgi:hypothetical protein